MAVLCAGLVIGVVAADRQDEKQPEGSQEEPRLRHGYHLENARKRASADLAAVYGLAPHVAAVFMRGGTPTQVVGVFGRRVRNSALRHLGEALAQAKTRLISPLERKAICGGLSLKRLLDPS